MKIAVNIQTKSVEIITVDGGFTATTTLSAQAALLVADTIKACAEKLISHLGDNQDDKPTP